MGVGGQCRGGQAVCSALGELDVLLLERPRPASQLPHNGSATPHLPRRPAPPCAAAGVTDAGLRPRPIKRVAVLGGGLMGSGIATACALAGIDVLLKEVNQKFLDVSVHSVYWSVLLLGWHAISLWLLLGDSWSLNMQAPPTPTHPTPMQAGLGRIQANLTSRVKKGRMSEAAAQAAMARVKVRRRLCVLFW